MMMDTTTIERASSISGYTSADTVFRFDVGHDLHIRDVSPDHLLEVAALLAGEERGGVNAREECAVRLEGLRQRAPSPHPVVHVVQNRLEDRIGRPAPEDVEGLNERHAGLEQRRELLVEDHEFASRDPRAPQERDAGETRAAGPMQPEDVAGPFPRTRA